MSSINPPDNSTSTEQSAARWRNDGLLSQHVGGEQQLPFPDHAHATTHQNPSASLPDTSPYLAVPQPFPDAAASPSSNTHRLPDPTSVPGFGGPITPPPSVPEPRMLPDLQPGTYLPALKNPTSSLRPPVVIRGSGRKGPQKPPKRSSTKSRLMLHIAVTVVLVFIIMGSLIAVLPTGGSNRQFGLLSPIMDLVNTKGNNSGRVASQAATATAVTQGGYDPGGGQTFDGVPTPPPGATTGGLGRFFYGQCTWWANKRYHDLTGQWVPWLGNANAWSAGGRSYNWIVSPTPKVPSIIVLQAGVQGAGYYGHVAIVEKINKDGSVHTSNFNWLGAWGQLTYVTFYPGPGVSFVYFPGT